MSSARDLRESFDASFALPRGSNGRSEIDFLAVRLGADAYALSVSELAGVFADKAIIPAPARSPAFIGLAGVRSAIVPVFDLGVILGYARLASVRWFAISSKLGFAFEALEGHLRVETTAIAPHAAGGRRHTTDVVRIDGQLRSIIRLSSIVSALAQKDT